MPWRPERMTDDRWAGRDFFPPTDSICARDQFSRDPRAQGVSASCVYYAVLQCVSVRDVRARFFNWWPRAAPETRSSPARNHDRNRNRAKNILKKKRRGRRTSGIHRLFFFFTARPHTIDLTRSNSRSGKGSHAEAKRNDASAVMMDDRRRIKDARNDGSGFVISAGSRSAKQIPPIKRFANKRTARLCCTFANDAAGLLTVSHRSRSLQGAE